tara:strand:- start:1141 stop:1959 length:819 start_codon:yes stop_codon:yes gene_type:complete
MKLKHNKKRNTMFLYEALVKELTKSIVKKDKERKDTVLSILREHFSKNSTLHREMQLYKDILDSEKLDFHTAEKLLYESVRTYWHGFDRKEVHKEQGKVVNKVNKKLSKNVFSNFVPNYKNLATLSQIFGDDLTAKQRVMLERQMLDNMVSESKKEEGMKPIDSLTYKTFVKKFNSTYNMLPEEQQKLLNHYILSFRDNQVELKIFLNEELGRLRKIIESSLELKEIKTDESMLNKTKEIANLMEGFKKQEIDENLIKQVLKIQELAREIDS